MATNVLNTEVQSSAKPVLAVSNEVPRDTTNEIGTSVTKGSQLTNLPFKDAIVAVYSNITNSPTLTTFFILVALVTLFDGYGITNGPLELIVAFLKAAGAKTDSAFMNLLIGLALAVFGVFVQYKYLFIVLGNLALPILFKPSTKNFTFAIFLVFMGGILYNIPSVIYFFIGQIWFVLTQLRNVRTKFVIYFGIGAMAAFFVFSLNDPMTQKKYGIDLTKPTPTPVPVQNNRDKRSSYEEKFHYDAQGVPFYQRVDRDEQNSRPPPDVVTPEPSRRRRPSSSPPPTTTNTPPITA